MTKRKNILICDDQMRFIETFKENHSSTYDIREETDIRKLIERIDDNKPDLVLLDLYHSNKCHLQINEAKFKLIELYKQKIEVAKKTGTAETTEIKLIELFEQKIKDVESSEDVQEVLVELNKQNIANGEAALLDLKNQIRKTDEEVNKAWEPLGLELLNDIRQKYSSRKLPVIIYSQTGLVLLKDDQVKNVEENDGHWMLKGAYSAATEQVRMDRVMAYSGKAKPILLVYRIVLILSWSIFLLLASLFLFKLELMWDFLISVIGGIGTYVVTKVIESSN